MTQTSTLPIVAIMNGDADIVIAIQDMLVHEGFNAVTLLIPEVKRGKIDFVEFVRVHNPGIVLYDIAPPYEQAMTFSRTLLNTEVMKGRKVILTTTNKNVLEQMYPDVKAHELIGKPYDMDALLALVRSKV